MAQANLVTKNCRLTIELDVYDVLHDVINGEQRQNLIESLSCHDEVINHVVEQLVDGYTFNGFSGSWSTSRNTAIQKARDAIYGQSDKIARKTLEELTDRIQSLESQLFEANKQLNIIKRDK
jgi:hypothetical protein